MTRGVRGIYLGFLRYITEGNVRKTTEDMWMAPRMDRC